MIVRGVLFGVLLLCPRFLAAQEVPEFRPVPPLAPVGQVRELTESDGTVTRSFKNEWGYDVHDYGNGLKLVRRPENLLEDQGPDKERARALRAEGFVFVDRTRGDSLKRLDACTYEVSYRLSTQEVSKRTLILGCMVAPLIDVSIRAEEGGSLRYSYTVRNGADARQRIMMVQVDLPKHGILSDKNESSGWQPIGSDVAMDLDADVLAALPVRMTWAPAPVPANLMIPAGGTVEGLEFTSRYLPALTTATFLGRAEYPPDSPRLEEHFPDALERAFSDLVAASTVRRTTIGPQIPPPTSTEERLAVLDRTLADVDLAASAGLISHNDEGTLSQLLAAARGRPNKEVLLETAAKVSRIKGMTVGYRDAVVLVLQALAIS